MLPAALALLAAFSLAAPPAPEGRPTADASLGQAPGPLCPDEFLARRKGGCWTATELYGGRSWAYVHPAGWFVSKRCLDDPRFAGRSLLDALDAAARKIDPGVKAPKGCLGTFNPEWGRDLLDFLWRTRTALDCPAHDPKDSACATHSTMEYRVEDRSGRWHGIPYHLVTLANVAGCTHEKGSGLAGVLFHETLHAAGADNLSTKSHNEAWSRNQFEFVQDRVYGAEAVCFFGVRPELRPKINFLQCKRTVEYLALEPRDELCRDFDASFTDLELMPGFIKH